MQQHENAMPLALTIAGLDPSGGAGVIADLRAFSAFGCSPAAAITSITFQNDDGVFGAEHLSVEIIRRQIMAIGEGRKVACAKTGMLPTREVVRAVARLFRETDLPSPVVDPVIRSSSGYRLMDEDALAALLEELLPLAHLVTPNITEAEQITGLRINDVEGMRAAANAIRERGARAVLIKGGHLEEQEAGGSRQTAGRRKQKAGGKRQAAGGTKDREAIDVLDDAGLVTVFRGEWIEGGYLRGTGCLLSAAIAACLGNGMTLVESVSKAKQFVAQAISSAPRKIQGANQ